MPVPGSSSPPGPWAGRTPSHDPEPRNLPAYQAAAHRRRLLRRTRAISLSIAGGAAVASLGLGTAFAHAIPGHARVTGSRPAPGSGRPAGVTAPSPGPSGPGGARPGGSGPSARRRARTSIAPPTQAPASTPAAPQVSSGGS